MPGMLSQIVGASSPAEIVQTFEDHIQLTEESTA